MSSKIKISNEAWAYAHKHVAGWTGTAKIAVAKAYDAGKFAQRETENLKDINEIIEARKKQFAELAAKADKSVKK